MPDRKSRKRVSKRNIKVSYEKKKLSRNNRGNRDIRDNRDNQPRISKDDFPSLISNPVIKPVNKYVNNIPIWRKSDNSFTIFTKAKKGSVLLNSYPIFPDTPEFPLFQ